MTDEFIAHLRAGRRLDLDQASEFLVIASTLLDLKAARLLPAADVDDEEDLEPLEARDLLFARLLQYKAYKQAAAFLRLREAEAAQRHPRSAGLEPRFADLMPEVLLDITPSSSRRWPPEALTPKVPETVSVSHLRAGRERRRAAPGGAQPPGARGYGELPRAHRRLRAHLEVVARFLAAGALPAAAGGLRAADAVGRAASGGPGRSRATTIPPPRWTTMTATCRKPARRTTSRTTSRTTRRNGDRRPGAPRGGAGAHLLGGAGRRARCPPPGSRRRERGEADPTTWDAVAAELASRVADRPLEEPPPPPVESRAAAGAQDPTPADVPAGEPARSEAPADEPLQLLDPWRLQGGLEALLFVMDDPVDEETLARALRAPPSRSSRSRRADRGLRPASVGTHAAAGGGGWRLYTREEHAPVVERYLIDGQRSRLTQAALETLAVIAYRQPVTRARISGIRGVEVDGVMRTLITAGWCSRWAPTPTAAVVSTRRRRCSWNGSG